MTPQLPLPAEAAPATAPSDASASHERVLRMAAATLYLTAGSCWTRPIAELVADAQGLAERMRSSRARADDLRDVEAWLADAGRWLLSSTGAP